MRLLPAISRDQGLFSADAAIVEFQATIEIGPYRLFQRNSYQ